MYMVYIPGVTHAARSMQTMLLPCSNSQCSGHVAVYNGSAFATPMSMHRHGLLPTPVVHADTHACVWAVVLPVTDCQESSCVMQSVCRAGCLFICRQSLQALPIGCNPAMLVLRNQVWARSRTPTSP